MISLREPLDLTVENQANATHTDTHTATSSSQQGGGTWTKGHINTFDDWCEDVQQTFQESMLSLVQTGVTERSIWMRFRVAEDGAGKLIATRTPVGALFNSRVAV